MLSAQGTDGESGLSEAAASERLAKHGPNKLKEEEKTPLWIRFFQQMADPMVIMLIVAAIISAASRCTSFAGACLLRAAPERAMNSAERATIAVVL